MARGTYIRTAKHRQEMREKLTKRTTEQRLLGLVEKSESGCWNWIGGKTREGYGVFHLDGKSRRAHRVAYELFVGPIPIALTLDHLCRNRSCVNPKHLEPVTAKENLARGRHWEREKTHCAAGHEFTETNTYLWKGERHCRECRRVARNASYHRNKGERQPPTAKRTHCPHGHAYDEENTYITPTGGRACRTCNRERRRSTPRSG